MAELNDILIPIISVVLSAITAIIVARLQVKAATQKLNLEYRKKATDQLFQKRMEVYPKFHSLLLRFVKKRRTEGLTRDDLLRLTIEFDNWEIENAVYVSPLGLEKMGRSRILFHEILDQVKEGENLSNIKIKKIIPEIYSLQMILKTELGIIDADSFHNPRIIKHFDEIINFQIQNDRNDKC